MKVGANLDLQNTSSLEQFLVQKFADLASLTTVMLPHAATMGYDETTHKFYVNENGAIKQLVTEDDLTAGTVVEVNPEAFNSYYGERVQPVSPTSHGFFVDRDDNSSIGMLVRNTSTGNSAYAGYVATINPSDPFADGISMEMFGPNYFGSRLASTGSIFASTNASTSLGRSTDKWEFLISQSPTSTVTDFAAAASYDIQGFKLHDIADDTKTALFAMNLIATGTMHTYNMPNKSGTVALIDDITGGGSLVLETYNESGTRVLGNSVAIIGDYDDSGNGTKLTIDDATGTITAVSDFHAEGDIISMGGGKLGIDTGSFLAEILAGTVTANRAYELPNNSGTLALTSDIQNLTGYSESGTLGTGIIVSIGDHPGINNDTKITVDDAAQTIRLDAAVSSTIGGGTISLEGNLIRLGVTHRWNIDTTNLTTTRSVSLPNYDGEIGYSTFKSASVPVAANYGENQMYWNSDQERLYHHDGGAWDMLIDTKKPQATTVTNMDSITEEGAYFWDDTVVASNSDVTYTVQGTTYNLSNGPAISALHGAMLFVEKTHTTIADTILVRRQRLRSWTSNKEWIRSWDSDNSTWESWVETSGDFLHVRRGTIIPPNLTAFDGSRRPLFWHEDDNVFYQWDGAAWVQLNPLAPNLAALEPNETLTETFENALVITIPPQP